MSKELKAGSQTPVLQPLARSPVRHGGERIGPSPEALLPPLLFLDFRYATGLNTILEAYDSSASQVKTHFWKLLRVIRAHRLCLSMYNTFTEATIFDFNLYAWSCRLYSVFLCRSCYSKLSIVQRVLIMHNIPPGVYGQELSNTKARKAKLSGMKGLCSNFQKVMQSFLISFCLHQLASFSMKHDVKLLTLCWSYAQAALNALI